MFTTIGLSSAAFIIAFTLWGAFYNNKTEGQSLRASMLEAWTNIGLRFPINYAANLWILDHVNRGVSMVEGLHLSMFFTAISVVLSFFIRRFYNWKEHRKLEPSRQYSDHAPAPPSRPA